MKKRALLLGAVALIGCEGAVGPMGPEGFNAALRWEAAEIAADGTALVTFTGAQVETSVISCWIGERMDGTWFAIAFDAGVVMCGATNSGPDLQVHLAGGVPGGWYFLVTIAHAVEP